MTTTIPTRCTVILPAADFAAHKLQRMFLTRRHATVMQVSAPIAARRALQVAPARATSKPASVGQKVLSR